MTTKVKSSTIDLTTFPAPASLLSGTTLNSSVVTSSLTTVGTVTTGTWSGLFGAVSGANLTSLTAANLSGTTLPSGITTSSLTTVGTLTSLNIGTSAIAGARVSALSISVTAGEPSWIFQGDANTERMSIRSSSAAVYQAFSCSGTIGSPTALASATNAGGFQFGGYDGSAWVRGGLITGTTGSLWSVTNREIFLSFYTTPSTSITAVERMRIASTGNVSISNAITSTKKLLVYGTGQTVGNITDAGNQGSTIFACSDAQGAGDGGVLAIGTNSSGTLNTQWALKSYLQNGGSFGISDLIISGRAVTTDTNLTERIRITSNGNFLFKNSAEAIYDTNGGANVSGYWGAQFASTNGTGKVILGSNGTNNSVVGGAMINTSSAPIISSYVSFQSSDTTAGAEKGLIYFYTKPSSGTAVQRAVIDDLGKLQIGNTIGTTTALVHLKSTAGNGSYGTDTVGMMQLESTYTTALDGNTNTSYTTKNMYGTSQFMQWVQSGLRIGSRIVTAGTGATGVGNVYFTQGNDTVIMTMTSTGVAITGLLSATTKSFIIDHPTKPNFKLRHGSLEGPENGVYVRGKLIGSCFIKLPEYWSKLVDPDSITVQITPIGRVNTIFVEWFKDDLIKLSSEYGNDNNIKCYYHVYGERIDVEKLVVEYEE